MNEVRQPVAQQQFSGLSDLPRKKLLIFTEATNYMFVSIIYEKQNIFNVFKSTDYFLAGKLRPSQLLQRAQPNQVQVIR